MVSFDTNLEHTMFELPYSIHNTHTTDRVDIKNTRLYDELMNLPKWKIELIMTACTQARKDKYFRRTEKLYGNLSKSFTEKQLHHFFSVITNKDHKIFFLIQYYLALRISELSRLVPDFEEDVVRIYSKKMNRFEYIPLFEPVRSLLKQKPKLDYNINSIRNKFMKYIQRAGLDYKYAPRKGGGNMHRLTTHSLRHTAITKVSKIVNGNPFKLTMYSRHNSSKYVGVVAVYNHYTIDDLRDDLSRAFNGENLHQQQLSKY